MPAVWSNDVKIAIAKLKKVKVAIIRFHGPSALPTANTTCLAKGVRELSGTCHIYIHGSSGPELRGRQQRLSQMGSHVSYSTQSHTASDQNRNPSTITAA